MTHGIRRIHSLVPRKAQDYGGKARGLSVLARAGFPVPPAFAVPGALAETVIEAAVPTEDRLPALLAEPFVERSRVQRSETRIREAELPDEVRKALVDAFEQLRREGADAVAVRSSSTIEDEDEASAAGLHATVLHVTSAQGLLDAVRTCWASLYSERVLAYLRVAGRGSGLRMGLVVQAMVPAEVSGVAFTMNPLTGDETEVVINAAYGLGSGVADGRVSPDTVRIDKSTGTPRDRVVGDKALRVGLAIGGGTREEPVPEVDRGRLCLSDAQVEAIASLALRLERHFEKPQDVEFAVVGNEVFVLQARPITAAAHRKTRKRATRKDRARLVWSNVNVGEALPGVATPLTWSVLSGFSDLGFRRAFGALGCTVPKDAELVGSFRGRIYLNMTEFLGIASQVPGISPRMLLALGGGDFADLVDTPVESPSSTAFLARLPVTAARFVHQSLMVEREMALFEAAFAAERRRLRAIDLRLLSPMALERTLTDVERLLDEVGAVMLRVYGSLLAQVVLLVGALRVLAGAESQNLSRDLLTGLSDLASATPGIAIARLAETLRRDEAARAFLAAHPGNGFELDALPDGPTKTGLSRFLDEFGHRGAREAEIAEPRWREDPSLLLSTLRLHLEGDTATRSLRQRDARIGEAKLRAHDRVEAVVPLPLRPVVRSLVRRVQRLLRMRESLRSDVTVVLGLFRAVAMDVSRRIEVREPEAGEGAAFFLTLDELHGVLAGRLSHVTVRVQQRRVQYERDLALPDPPDTFVGYPPAGREDLSETSFLVGLPASAGEAEGRVRVLRAPEDAASFRPGEVLVAPCADVGWSPLFLAAAAVVTDLGGPLSHAAIVLREYGVPAVVNVKHGTRLLRDGELVRVHGDTGRVARLERQDAP